MFFDIIIEDDSGEIEKPPDIVPYQLSKEAAALDMTVGDIKVRSLNITHTKSKLIYKTE